jgi:hypothetical protein
MARRPALLAVLAFTVVRKRAGLDQPDRPDSVPAYHPANARQGSGMMRWRTKHLPADGDVPLPIDGHTGGGPLEEMAPPEDLQSGAILPEPVLPSPPDVSPLDQRERYAATGGSCGQAASTTQLSGLSLLRLPAGRRHRRPGPINAHILETGTHSYRLGASKTSRRPSSLGHSAS